MMFFQKPPLMKVNLPSADKFQIMSLEFSIIVRYCSSLSLSTFPASLRWVMSRTVLMACHWPFNWVAERDNSTGNSSPPLRSAVTSDILPMSGPSPLARKCG